MELVVAHRNALSALDSVDVSQGTGNYTAEGEPQQKATHGEGLKDKQGGKAQILQEEEREKGRVAFSVY